MEHRVQAIIRVKPASKSDSTEWSITNNKITSSNQSFTFG